ncbi:T7SS effector LXG polymorphic toxin [Bacillus luti]|uniref:T7SS effector LXG polymorphic toxin n=1 Tax=Bacillus luti TaxID=2026191 RepID=UPI003D06F864
MSLNMYLGEVQSQTQSMNAVCTATIQGMEQAIQSIDAFAIDTVLQGQTYSSAKSFFVQTFRPLAQGIIYLCEELILQNNAFPNDFQSQVASTDVIEQEIREQIQQINQSIASIEAIDVAMPMPMPGIDAIVAVLVAMRKKLEEKLEHLYEFNYTSSSNYDTALQLAANIATGLAEVQSGKGFSPVSGTFSTQGLNMDWTTSIQKMTEAKAREADNFVNNNLSDDNIEEGTMYDTPPEKSMLRKIWDGIYVGSGEVIGGIVEGFDSLDDTVTKENIKYAIGHPLETAYTMCNTFSDSFMNDVWHGDLESGTKWGTNIFMGFGLGWIGDKGISRVGKVTTLGEGKNLAKFSEGISSVSNQIPLKDRFAFAGGNIITKIPQSELNQAYYNFAKTTISSAEKRKSPGTVTSSFNLERSLGTQKKLMYNNGSIGVIPQEIRNKLVGKEFKSFDEFRAEFWKTVADSSYANEFNRMNRMRMLEGKAPYTPGSEQYGAHKVYVLHHKQPIHQGGDVYNLDNLIIVSPKTHQTILDPAYHFGKKGL